MVAEKIVTEEEEKVLLIGPLSSDSLHSMGTHDSSSSLDWALDAAGSKVRCAALRCAATGCACWAMALATLLSWNGAQPA